MWFPSTYASVLSPFEGLSGLDYYVFLLNKLPAVAFGSTTYAAFVPTNATVRAPARACMLSMLQTRA